MSLCLAADAPRVVPVSDAPRVFLAPDAPRVVETARATASLSARLRRFLLSFDPVDEMGDMLPAPVVDRSGGARRQPASPPADEVNALLL